MDSQTRKEYFALQSWVGTQTVGLGALLRDCGGPGPALAASAARLSLLPPATQQALRRAMRYWPQVNSRSKSARESGYEQQQTAVPGSIAAGMECASPSDSVVPQTRRAVSQRSCKANPAAGDAAARSVFLPIGDDAYPALLRQTTDPPPWLFCAGDPRWLSRPSVAIVGTRRASEAGLHAAHGIASALAAAGYCVCSGLALGIDAAAHRGALKSGSTVAVLASGLDCASPVRHRRLARRVSTAGCVVTELPRGTPPSKYQFPRRNRIISGLASATIIVEAALPSGTLHTAAAALEQGRDVYTLPWSIFHLQGAGCLRLLRDGAIPITSMDDLEGLFPGVHTQAKEEEPSLSATPAALPAEAQRLLDLIGDSALSLQTLQFRSGLASKELLLRLGELELIGWVKRIDGLYQRKSKRS